MAADLVPDVRVLLRAVRNPSKKYSSSELIELLREAATRAPGPLTTDEYDLYVREHPTLPDGRATPGKQTMGLRWGTWVGALAAADLPSNPSSQVPKLFEGDQAAISALVTLWREKGEPPTADDYEGWSAGLAGAPSLSTARKLAGSWNTMLLRAWEVVHQIKLPQEDLDAALPPALLAQIGVGELASSNSLPLAGVAQRYVVADENAIYQASMDTMVTGYKAQERALTSHARLQNAVASEIQKRDLVPLSPKGQNVLFDLAFELRSGVTVVVEVKSANDANNEMQLRIGLGQVLRYARQLSTHGPVIPMIAIERALPDQDWVGLLEELGVAVVVQSSLGVDLDVFLTRKTPQNND